MKLKDLGLKIATPKEKIIPYIAINIVGDYNDGDYIETNEKWTLDETDKEGIKTIKDSIKFLRKNYNTLFKRHFVTEPDENDEDICEEFIESFDIPFCVDDYCHTIKKINLTYTDEKGTTYKLELVKEVDPFEDSYEEEEDEYEDEID